MRISTLTTIFVFVLSLTFLGSLSCSKTDKADSDASSDSENGKGDETTDTGTLAVGEDLGGAYPDSLAIAVFPETVDTEAATAGTIAVSFNLAEGDDDRTLRQKISDQRDFLAGKGDSCLPEALKGRQPRGKETCYEFDQDMIFGSAPGGLEGSNNFGTHDGKNSAGEACLVSFARTEVDNVVTLVEQTTAYVQAAICQTKKDSPKSGLPGLQESLDLKEALSKALGNRAQNITSAEMKRIADSDGRAVYKTRIDVVDNEGRRRTIEIAHSPAEDGSNDTYDGRIYLVMEGDVGGSGGAPGPGGSGKAKKRLLSVQYARVYIAESQDYRIRYELRTAKMVDHIAKIAFEDGILNLNASTNGNGDYVKADGQKYQNSNEAVAGIKYVSFDMNPDTNEGTLSYWQNPGGNYGENTRGLVFDLKHDEEGNFKGCANSGSAGIDFSNGMSIRKALKTSETLQPVGFYHPFHNTDNPNGCTFDSGTDAAGTFYQKTCTTPNQMVIKWYEPKIADAAKATQFATKQAGGLITRQCYIQDKTSGLYIIDTTEVDEDAGFELIKTTDSTKFIKPPRHEFPPPPPQEN